MRLRSLLFVPGDRPDRMEKALGTGADALILDLEDAVTSARKAEARSAVAAFLSRPERPLPLFVRINPISGPDAGHDLVAVASSQPDGIVLPKAEGGRSVAELDGQLRALGNSDAVILPIATETPAAIFALGSFGGVTPRLCALTWGVEDLSAAVGAITTREAEGRYSGPYETVRSLALFAAHAAEIPAIETVFPEFRDLGGLALTAGRARRDGFAGMMAVHPSQIPVINAAFTPTPEQLERASRIVALFEANPGAGALSLDGAMVDAPHLKNARRILQLGAD